MKVLLINGSPHEKGCTYTALSLIAGELTQRHRDRDPERRHKAGGRLHRLRRLCRRALVGLSRTGSYCGNGSGEIVIAFTTANRVPHYSEKALLPMTLLHDDAINFVPGGGRVRGGKRSQQPAPR